MGCELENRLRGGKEEYYDLFDRGDELAALRKKQSQPASQRSQPSQESGGRRPRASNRQTLAPLVDATTRISRSPSVASHQRRQQSQSSLPPRLLELQTQQWANVRPGPRELDALPEDGFDFRPPPMSTPIALLTPPTNELVSVDMVFVGVGWSREVPGHFVQSCEHSFVSPSLAANMGKRGLEAALPLQSHGTAGIAQMTVRVPVRAPNGQATHKDVEIWAQVGNFLEGDNYLLGWRARNKIDSVRNGHSYASRPGDALASHLANGGYVDPAAINMPLYSPPPSSAHTMYPGNMNPSTAQHLPVSPFQDSFDHDMSTLDGLVNDTGTYPDVMAGTQAAPMPTGPEWANPTLSIDVLDAQFTPASNHMMGGTETTGTNVYQDGSPEFVAQNGQIRWNMNVIDADWWSPQT